MKSHIADSSWGGPRRVKSYAPAEQEFTVLSSVLKKQKEQWHQGCFAADCSYLQQEYFVCISLKGANKAIKKDPRHRPFEQQPDPSA